MIYLGFNIYTYILRQIIKNIKLDCLSPLFPLLNGSFGESPILRHGCFLANHELALVFSPSNYRYIREINLSTPMFILTMISICFPIMNQP